MSWPHGAAWTQTSLTMVVKGGKRLSVLPQDQTDQPIEEAELSVQQSGQTAPPSLNTLCVMLQPHHEDDGSAGPTSQETQSC